MISNDPQSDNPNDWVVILNDPWDRVVGRYENIEITEKGTRLNFRFEPVHVPDGTNIEGEGFLDHISEVLASIIRDHHDRDATMYYSKETGERLDV